MIGQDKPGVSPGLWRAFWICVAFDVLIGAGVVLLVRWVT